MQKGGQRSAFSRVESTGSCLGTLTVPCVSTHCPIIKLSLKRNVYFELICLKRGRNTGSTMQRGADFQYFVFFFFFPRRKSLLYAATNVALSFKVAWEVMSTPRVAFVGSVHFSLAGGAHVLSLKKKKKRGWGYRGEHACSSQPRVQYQIVHADSVLTVMYLLL